MKPMLACSCELTDVRFPCLVQPKLDGIRAIVKDGVVLSRSLKPIRNKHVQRLLSHLEGFDGELISGDTFQQTTSNIMSSDGDDQFVFVIFDNYLIDEEYSKRWYQLTELVEETDVHFEVIETRLITDIQQLKAIESKYLADGYEGIIIRSLDSPYKFGRSTIKEGYLLKRKPFSDAEAIVVDFVEQLENTNEQTIDALGHKKRTTHKELLVPKGTLGSFLVYSKTFGLFNIGTGLGLTDELRSEIWANKVSYLGKTITFKYQQIGTDKLPRIPIFLHFRDSDDV